jgi:hypothetical protein
MSGFFVRFFFFFFKKKFLLVVFVLSLYSSGPDPLCRDRNEDGIENLNLYG